MLPAPAFIDAAAAIGFMVLIGAEVNHECDGGGGGGGGSGCRWPLPLCMPLLALYCEDAGGCGGGGGGVLHAAVSASDHILGLIWPGEESWWWWWWWCISAAAAAAAEEDDCCPLIWQAFNTLDTETETDTSPLLLARWLRWWWWWWWCDGDMDPSSRESSSQSLFSSKSPPARIPSKIVGKFPHGQLNEIQN